jgi:hypothetical protein
LPKTFSCEEIREKETSALAPDCAGSREADRSRQCRAALIR